MDRRFSEYQEEMAEIDALDRELNEAAEKEYKADWGQVAMDNLFNTVLPSDMALATALLDGEGSDIPPTALGRIINSLIFDFGLIAPELTQDGFRFLPTDRYMAIAEQAKHVDKLMEGRDHDDAIS